VSARIEHPGEVYRAESSDAYSPLIIADPDSVAELLLDQFDGTPIVGELPDVLLTPCRDYGILPLPDCDLPYGLGAIVVSQKAVDCLGDILRLAGELYPARTSTGSYYFLNVTTVIDCLDYDKSVLEFWPALPQFMKDGLSGRHKVHHVSRYEFLPDRIGGAPLFKLPEFPSSPPYVTCKFVHEFAEAGLTGLEFRKVWPEPDDAAARQMFLAKHRRKRQRKRRDGSP